MLAGSSRRDLFMCSLALLGVTYSCACSPFWRDPFMRLLAPALVVWLSRSLASPVRAHSLTRCCAVAAFSDPSFCILVVLDIIIYYYRIENNHAHKNKNKIKNNHKNKNKSKNKNKNMNKNNSKSKKRIRIRTRTRKG